jgi:galactokinase
MIDKIEDPSADLVPLSQLAVWFNIDKTNVRKWLLDQGFRVRRVRLEEAGNQLCLALSRQEAKEAIERRQQLGFCVQVQW